MAHRKRQLEPDGDEEYDRRVKHLKLFQLRQQKKYFQGKVTTNKILEKRLDPWGWHWDRGSLNRMLELGKDYSQRKLQTWGFPYPNALRRVWDLGVRFNLGPARQTFNPNSLGFRTDVWEHASKYLPNDLLDDPYYIFRYKEAREANKGAVNPGHMFSGPWNKMKPWWRAIDPDDLVAFYHDSDYHVMINNKHGKPHLQPNDSDYKMLKALEAINKVRLEQPWEDPLNPQSWDITWTTGAIQAKTHYGEYVNKPITHKVMYKEAKEVWRKESDKLGYNLWDKYNFKGSGYKAWSLLDKDDPEEKYEELARNLYKKLRQVYTMIQEEIRAREFLKGTYDKKIRIKNKLAIANDLQKYEELALEIPNKLGWEGYWFASQKAPGSNKEYDDLRGEGWDITGDRLLIPFKWDSVAHNLYKDDLLKELKKIEDEYPDIDKYENIQKEIKNQEDILKERIAKNKENKFLDKPERKDKRRTHTKLAYGKFGPFNLPKNKSRMWRSVTKTSHFE